MCNKLEYECQIIRIMRPLLYLAEMPNIYVYRVKIMWILLLWKGQLQLLDMQPVPMLRYTGDGNKNDNSDPMNFHFCTNSKADKKCRCVLNINTLYTRNLLA